MIKMSYSIDTHIQNYTANIFSLLLASISQPLARILDTIHYRGLIHATIQSLAGRTGKGT